MTKDTSKWGRETAKERYGKGQGSLSDHPKANNLQSPQDPQDQHEDTYNNDSEGWVNGHGSPYPHFDHTKKGK
jgi:hypothetical protein